MRRIARVALAVTCLAVPALAAAGCGGGDSSSGSTATVTALTADQWRAKADAICADADTKGKALPTPNSASEVQAFLESAIPIAQDETDQLKALVPPSELASIQSQAVALQQQGIDKLQEVLDKIKGGTDPNSLVAEVGTQFDKLNTDLDKLAADAGLKVCGKDDSSTGTDTTSTDTTTDTTSTETTSTDTTSVPTTGDAQVDAFLQDVQKATGALTAFGTALQSVASPEDLKGQVSSLRGKLGDFDTAIGAMDGYTLDNATLEGQRSRLVATGPKVSDTLREFVDVAAEVKGPEDLAKITTVLPKVATALQDFSAAAQPK